MVQRDSVGAGKQANRTLNLQKSLPVFQKSTVSSIKLPNLSTSKKVPANVETLKQGDALTKVKIATKNKRFKNSSITDNGKADISSMNRTADVDLRNSEVVQKGEGLS